MTSFSMGVASAKQAQADQMVGLQNALRSFKDVSLKRDVAGIMAFIHPALFTKMSIERVKKMITEARADGKVPTLRGMDFQQISPIRPYSAGVLAVVGTTREFTMQRPGDVTPQIDALMIGLIKKRMGEVETSIDEKNDVILIKQKSWLLALNEGGAGWKFIDKDRIKFFVENNLLSDEIMGLVR